MRSGCWSRALTAIADGISPENGPLLWKPIDGPQRQAFESEADELFYGGAAGGGKSDLLLGLGTTAHTRSVIFRREYPQLRDLLDRVVEIVGAHGTLNRGTGVLNMMGRKVQFGSCPHEQNKFRWQGRPHDLKGFDEITHFTRPIFVYLKTWARSALPDQRVRIVCTGNPPTTTEGAWVIDYWAPWLDKEHPNPAVPGELRWFVTSRDGTSDIEVDGPDPVAIEGEILHPRSRTFIPALLSDNPYLSSDADYLAVIQSLPEPLRSQMLYGRFDVDADDDEWQVIPSEWYDMAVHRWEVMEEAVDQMTALGVDVARGGADRSVFFPKHGDWFGHPILKSGKVCRSGREVAGEVIKITSRVDGEVKIGIDVIGVGSSPYDLLVDAGANVTGINFGEGTDGATDRSGKYKLANVRAACYWGFREALDPEYSRICIPPDKGLRAELLAPKWKLKAGRIYIEGKDEIKARLGRSPDLADALVLAWYADRRRVIEFW
jgi:hypothetical protein